MDVELRYRAELADQFIDRLRALTPAQWRELVERHRQDDSYYRLALELVSDATQMLGADRMRQYEMVLTRRSTDVEGVVRDATEIPAAVAATAVALATAAIHALLVRDAYGFNAGAFSELFRPFRSLVDLADLERSATQVLAAQGLVRHPPSDTAPGQR